MPKIAVILLLMIFSVGANAAKYYKWQDEKGLTHYTAIAPEGRASDVINTRTGAQKTFAEKKSDSNSKKTTPLTKPKPAPVAPEVAPPSKKQLANARRQQKENCDATRKNMETLNVRARVRINDSETGELRFLTPDEHAEMKNKSQKHLDEFCK